MTSVVSKETTNTYNKYGLYSIWIMIEPLEKVLEKISSDEIMNMADSMTAYMKFVNPNY